MSGCTGTGKRVQILLSTYNGEEYLQAQLESFLQMNSFAQCCVLIRDDGSTDGTKEILGRYEKIDGFHIEYGDHIGITGSYKWLLDHGDTSCDYYAFSDQDDVWLPDKIGIALRLLDGEDNAQPLLFASLTQVVDKNLKPIATSVYPRRGVSFYNAMVQNVLPGHTQVINKVLKNIICARGFDDIHVIDWWYYLVAAAVGKVIYYPQYTVKHRQHGQNAVGFKMGLIPSLVRRLKYIAQGRGNAFSKQLKAFYLHYSDLLSQEIRDEIEDYFNSMRSVVSRIRYVGRCKAYRQNTAENMMFKILYVIGKYNVKGN